MEKTIEKNLFGYCRFNIVLSQYDLYRPCFVLLLQWLPDEIFYAWKLERMDNDAGVFHLVFSYGDREASVSFSRMAADLGKEWDQLLKGMGLKEDAEKSVGDSSDFVRYVALLLGF